MSSDIETRDKIMSAAKKLAMADGIFNISVQEIVELAGVEEEIFYKFFNSLDDVVTKLFDTRFGLADNEILVLPLEEKIRIFNSELIKQIELAGVKNCRKWVANNIQPVENPRIDLDRGLVSKILKSSIDSGELLPNTPEEEFSNFIISALYGLMMNWCMTDMKYEPLEHIDTISEFILNSLKPYIAK
ncbi:MAG: TetR/AcrR family transcriptional regulator [Synergistaceae bacterium]|nr:TetR/AcrR family transcriptional regulator [Synergistaceae bacterium]